jgi:hypothetical protein
MTLEPLQAETRGWSVPLLPFNIRLLIKQTSLHELAYKL